MNLREKREIGIEYKKGGISMFSLAQKYSVSIRSVRTAIKLTSQLTNVDLNVSRLDKFNKNKSCQEKYFLISHYIIKGIQKLSEKGN